MAQTVAQVIAALAASDRCAIVSMRSPKATFREILNDFKSTENQYQVLESGGTSDQTGGARRLVLVIDRMDSTDSGQVKVERRV